MTAIRLRSIRAACRYSVTAASSAESESRELHQMSRSTQRTRRQLPVDLDRLPAAPGVVFINGVQLPFVNQTTQPPGVGTGSFTGSFFAGPSASPGTPPEGMLVTPVAGPLGGLAVSDVTQIINNAITTANTTRAVIRLPIGSVGRAWRLPLPILTAQSLAYIAWPTAPCSALM